MAGTARTDARGQATLAGLLLLLAAAGSLGGRPAGAQGTIGPPAPADSSVLLAQAAGTGTASPTLHARPAPEVTRDGVQTLEPGDGLTLRRAVNPRYHAPVPGAAQVASPLGRFIGTEYAHAQITQFSGGPAFRSTAWDLVAGRERGARQRFELLASGASSTTLDQIRTLRLTSLQGPLEWSLGDVAAQPIGMLPWIQRLRGGMLVHALRLASGWRAMGGVVPTLTRGVTPNTALAALLFEDLPLQDARLTLGLMGFGRRAPAPGLPRPPDADSLPGTGLAALYAVRVAAGYGTVGATYMVQVHDLDGAMRPAGLQALEWRIDRPNLIASVRDQVGTRNARQPGTERLSVAASHDGRASAQLRFLKGQAELHLAGLTSAPSDVDLGAQTVEVGTSGNLGASGWYSGVDMSWNRRAPLVLDERRISAQTGRVTERGNTVLLRVEHTDNNLGPDLLQLTGEGATTLRGGLRLSLEPRFDWRSQRLERGMFSARLGWPLFGASTRMNAALTVSSARDQDFRRELSEASVSIAFVPRPHDRAALEARRYEEGGMRSLEFVGSYDTQTSLYASPLGRPVDQHTGTLTVTVAQADSARGVPDALVSLDGKEFRFTDGDGVARFPNVAPGSHVVSVAERTLPASQRVVGSATAFITIERGRTPEPVRFEIARPVRRVRF